MLKLRFHKNAKLCNGRKNLGVYSKPSKILIRFIQENLNNKIPPKLAEETEQVLHTTWF
jgi:hypothetical protein